MELCPKQLKGLPTLCGRKISKKHGFGLCKDHSEEKIEEDSGKVNRWKSEDYRRARKNVLREEALKIEEKRRNNIATTTAVLPVNVEAFEKISEYQNKLNKEKGRKPRLPFSERSSITRKSALDRWSRVRDYRDSLPFACNLRDAERMMMEDANKNK